jgi:hypothetical protein
MHYFVFIGLGIQLISGVVYCRAAVQKDVTPQRTSWLLWTVSPLIAVCIALEDGATWGVIPIAAAALVPLAVLVFAVSTKRGSWKFDALSIVCLVLASAAIVFELFGSSMIAGFATLVLEVSATLPTLRKAWSSPHSESALSYLLNCLSMATTLFAVYQWTFEQVAFPIFAAVLAGGVSIVIVARKRALAAQPVLAAESIETLESTRTGKSLPPRESVQAHRLVELPELLEEFEREMAYQCIPS